MAIPKEPGLYPVIQYDKEQNIEYTGTVLIDKECLEKQQINGVMWMANSKSYAYVGCSPAPFSLYEFGPAIQFPKGGWRN